MIFRYATKRILSRIVSNLMFLITSSLAIAAAISIVYLSVYSADKTMQSITGANILMLPKTEFLTANSLSTLDKIFWKNNIVEVAPILVVSDTVEQLGTIRIGGSWFSQKWRKGETGLDKIGDIELLWGRYPKKGEALVSHTLPQLNPIKLGKEEFKVVGKFRSSIPFAEILLNLEDLQKLYNKEDKLSFVKLKALTIPEKAPPDPKKLSIEQFDKWYCKAYASSIAYQLEEADPTIKAEVIKTYNTASYLIYTKFKKPLLRLAFFLATSLFIAAIVLGNIQLKEIAKEKELLTLLGDTTLFIKSTIIEKTILAVTIFLISTSITYWYLNHLTQKLCLFKPDVISIIEFCLILTFLTVLITSIPLVTVKKWSTG